MFIGTFINSLQYDLQLQAIQMMLCHSFSKNCATISATYLDTRKRQSWAIWKRYHRYLWAIVSFSFDILMGTNAVCISKHHKSLKRRRLLEREEDQAERATKARGDETLLNLNTWRGCLPGRGRRRCAVLVIKRDTDVHLQRAPSMHRAEVNISQQLNVIPSKILNCNSLLISVPGGPLFKPLSVAHSQIRFSIAGCESTRPMRKKG